MKYRNVKCVSEKSIEIKSALYRINLASRLLSLEEQTTFKGFKSQLINTTKSLMNLRNIYANKKWTEAKNQWFSPHTLEYCISTEGKWILPATVFKPISWWGSVLMMYEVILSYSCTLSSLWLGAWLWQCEVITQTLMGIIWPEFYFMVRTLCNVTIALVSLRIVIILWSLPLKMIFLPVWLLANQSLLCGLTHKLNKRIFVLNVSQSAVWEACVNIHIPQVVLSYPTGSLF